MTTANLYFFCQFSGAGGVIHHDALHGLANHTDAISAFLRHYLSGYLVHDVIDVLRFDHACLFAAQNNTNDLLVSHQFARACSWQWSQYGETIFIHYPMVSGLNTVFITPSERLSCN